LKNGKTYNEDLTMNAVVQQKQTGAITPLDSLKRAMFPQIKALANGDEKLANSLFATAVRIASDPKIMACTQPSIINCITRVIDLGLNLDPAFGEVNLIPYADYRNNNVMELQLQLGAKGYAALASNMGGWELQVIPIFDCDTYKVTRKLVNGFMESVTELEFNDLEREANAHNQDWCFEHLRCVMASARRFENGTWTVYSLEPAMSKGEINRRRLMSQAQKAGKYTKEPDKLLIEAGKPIGIWRDHFIAMAEKTALGALAKKLPKSKGVEKLIKAVNDDVVESTAIHVVEPQKTITPPEPIVIHEAVVEAEQPQDNGIDYAEFTTSSGVDMETGEVISNQPVETAEPTVEKRKPTDPPATYQGEQYLKASIDFAKTNNELVALWETVPDKVKPKFQALFDERQDLLRFGD
jgi:phage RecT family recombinase